MEVLTSDDIAEHVYNCYDLLKEEVLEGRIPLNTHEDITRCFATLDYKTEQLTYRFMRTFGGKTK